MKICINVKATQSLICTEVVQTFKKLETSTAAFCGKESKNQPCFSFCRDRWHCSDFVFGVSKNSRYNSIHISSQTMYCFGIR